jgi:ABC-type proline/glycine betaine transport system substrate-binding protein
VSVLGLTDAERTAVEEYVDDWVEPLKSIMKRWVDALDAKGRIPFGSTPLG